MAAVLPGGREIAGDDAVDCQEQAGRSGEELGLRSLVWYSNWTSCLFSH